MAQIPNDQKFHTLSANTPTVERGSAQADALREIYTMQDIIDSVSFGSGVASLDGLTGVVNLSGAGAVTVSNNGSDTITITGDAGVETLNSLVGGVTLVAGAGVTITDNGSDTITITSTGGGGAADLDDLTDVTITGTPAAGEILINNATTGQFVNSTLTAGTNVTITEADGSVTIAATGTGGATDLDGLTDVTITGTPGNGELLISQTDGTFVNTTLSAGPSGFVRITNASGQVTIGAGDGTEVEYLVRSTAVSSAGDVEGNTVKFGTTTGMTAGDVYVWNGTNWVQVDADADTTTKGLMGVALGASSADDGLLTHGVAYLSHNPGTAGDILYVDTAVAGYLTATQPSAQGDFVRVAGYCLADNKVFFSPSQDFIEIA